MSLPELLQLLSTLEDQVPMILTCKNQGVQLRLSPDGSGYIEAELKPRMVARRRISPVACSTH